MRQPVIGLRGVGVALVAGLLALALPASDVWAQSVPAAAPQGVLDGIWTTVLQAQRDLTGAMTGAVRRLKTGDVVSSTAFLAFVSFMYGVLHAVGPGHGKFVIASYALANEQTVRRGIALSFMAAVIQALSAIVLVLIATAVLKATSIQMRATEAWLESLSWALVAAVGAWLLWRQVGPLLPASRGAQHDHGHAHDHAHHDHDDGHAHDRPGAATAAAAWPADHVHDEHCGHVHFPPPTALQGQWSWREAWSLALSIGIRPCTGAILVLIFASSIGLFWAGVLATFAMAIGTALTVSALAAIAVGSRNLATRIAGADNAWAGRIQLGAGVIAALLVLGIGVSGLVVSLTGAAPL